MRTKVRNKKKINTQIKKPHLKKDSQLTQLKNSVRDQIFERQDKENKIIGFIRPKKSNPFGSPWRSG